MSFYSIDTTMTNETNKTEAGPVNGEQKSSKLVRVKVYFGAQKYLWVHEDEIEEEVEDLLYHHLDSSTDEYLESLDVISVERS